MREPSGNNKLFWFAVIIFWVLGSSRLQKMIGVLKRFAIKIWILQKVDGLLNMTDACQQS
jgi:uncharacterized membrane protein